MSDSFIDFCRSLGLKVNAVVPDGKWHRCGTDAKPRSKRGAWKLAVDGRIGWAWDPGLHSGAHTWRPEGSQAPDDFDPERLAAAREAAREQRRQTIEATRAARDFYEACEPLRDGHPYLEAKNLDMRGCHGLKVDRDGWLVVPAYRGSSLATLQRIAPDGSKLYWPGASAKNATYTIERSTAALHVVCEGLATGLAIYAAVPMSRVVVAFTTSGLVAAAENLPAGLAVIAADNDVATAARTGTNPGVVAAQAAAEASGAGIAIPDVGEASSDWCDLRNDLVAARLESWTRRSHETEQSIRRAVDAQIQSEIQRAARFRAPKMEDVK